MTRSAGASDRSLLVILSIVAGTIVVALAVIFLRGTPGVIDRATPEGVVQAYSVAVIDGNDVAARELLSRERKSDCVSMTPGYVAGMRITLVSSEVQDDSATVGVAILTHAGDGLFNSSAPESSSSFELVMDGESWMISSAPWELALCAPDEVSP